MAGFVDPQTVNNPTTGQVAPAAWGDAVRAATVYVAGGFAHCSIKESTPQTITTGSGSYTPLTSDEENSDIGGMHSTSVNTSRVTVPTGEGGLYTATACVTFADNQTGVRALAILVNGGASPQNAVAVTPAPVGFGTGMSIAASFVLVAGDYLEVGVFHTKGSNLACTLNDFSVTWRATA